MSRRVGLEQRTDAGSGRRVVSLKPRESVQVVQEDDSAQISQRKKEELRNLLLKKRGELKEGSVHELGSEKNLAELRKRALAALNLGLPKKQDTARARSEVSSTTASPRTSDRSARASCTCLRRDGICTCNEDRAWLKSKRKDGYYRDSRAPSGPARVARLVGGRSSSSTAAPATQSPDSDAIAHERREDPKPKRKRLAVPYVPPHCTKRDEDRQSKHAQAPPDDDVQSVDEEPEEVAVEEVGDVEAISASPASDKEPEDSWLEERGESCSGFNPLQMDPEIVVEDAQHIVAECVDHPLSPKGVKGLPPVQSGRYQFEVELLRDCSMTVGWSGAMTFPGVMDFQSYMYSSSGSKLHGKEESPYAKTYGKKGDIIGALIDWIEPETMSGVSSVELSFCLNGEALGAAFKVEGSHFLVDARKEAPIPLQPHMCQMPKGNMLKVKLRGSKDGAPLAHPVEGFQPLSEISDIDFCPFSAAIAAATSERVIMNLTPEHLKAFKLPEDHIVELYDFPSDASGETLMSSVACFLGLKVRDQGRALHVRITEAGCTALVALRRPEHVETLIEASRADGADDDFGVMECKADDEKKREKPLAFEARLLSSATARSKECLREWRGSGFQQGKN